MAQSYFKFLDTLKDKLVYGLSKHQGDGENNGGSKKLIKGPSIFLPDELSKPDRQDTPRPEGPRLRGVYWQPTYAQWRCAITIKCNKVFLGNFLDEREAALTYDAAAKFLGRPAANFPSEESDHIVLPARFLEVIHR